MFVKKETWMISSGLLCIGMLALCIFIFSQHPRHDRDWEVGQEKLPTFQMDGKHIKVKNFRDFTWHDDGRADIMYRTAEFDLSQLIGMDVVISHFDDFEGMAHIFVSFRFQEGENLAISVETRRENGEKFSPWLGLFRQFEMIYVVGSERDIIGMRTYVRNERVHIYPTVATPQRSEQLLMLLIQDINAIADRPVFYNTVFNNCTNVITRRVEEISDVSFPLTYRMILPGFVDDVLYKMNLIPSDRSFDEIKAYYRVNNDRVMPSDENYSLLIRQHDHK